MLHARRSAAVLVALPVLLVSLSGCDIVDRRLSVEETAEWRKTYELARRARRDPQRQRAHRGGACPADTPSKSSRSRRRARDPPRRRKRGAANASRSSRLSARTRPYRDQDAAQRRVLQRRRPRFAIPSKCRPAPTAPSFTRSTAASRSPGFRTDHGRDDQRRHRRPRRGRRARGLDHERRRRRRPGAGGRRRRQARLHQRRHQVRLAGGRAGDDLGERHQRRHRHRRAGARHARSRARRRLEARLNGGGPSHPDRRHERRHHARPVDLRAAPL